MLNIIIRIILRVKLSLTVVMEVVITSALEMFESQLSTEY